LQFGWPPPLDSLSSVSRGEDRWATTAAQPPLPPTAVAAVTATVTTATATVPAAIPPVVFTTM